MGGIALAAAILGGSLSVSVTPNKSSGGGISGPMSCPTVTAIVSGASGLVTYSWVQTNGDPLTINSPAGAGTNFTFDPPRDSGNLFTAVVRLTVTNGGNSAFCDVGVTYRDRNTF